MRYEAGRVHYGDPFKKYEDELNRIMEFFDGFNKDTSNIVVSEEAPSDPSAGLFWYQVDPQGNFYIKRRNNDNTDWDDLFTVTMASNVLDPRGFTVQDHLNDTDNPHEVTKQQIGLENVDNVLQASKEEFDQLNSEFTQVKNQTENNSTGLVDHLNDVSNPHGVTKQQVGLGSVLDIEQASKEDFDSLVLSVNDIDSELSNIGTSLGIHLQDTDNPHNVTKTQLGLGNVLDIEQASKEDFDAHVADYEQFKQDIEHEIGGDFTELEAQLQAHKEDINNPHSVTKEQVGLSNVLNIEQASKQAFDDLVLDYDDFKDFVYANIDGEDNPLRQELEDHITNINNPHNVTKDQIGLSNVLNIEQASKEELQGVEDIVSNLQITVDGHVGDTNNPHGVTKGQIGLGNVENYGVATQSEAVEGLVTNKFMTPLRTKEAVDVHANNINNPHNVTKDQIGLSNVLNIEQAPKQELTNHVEDSSNPHNVTKDQIGLSSVLNYGIATRTEAEDGTISTKYMTPERTRQAIASLESVKSVNNKLGEIILTKEDIGLGNVTNVEQAAKTTLDSHLSNSNNPHNVTSGQINVTTVLRSPSASTSTLPNGVIIAVYRGSHPIQATTLDEYLSSIGITYQDLSAQQVEDLCMVLETNKDFVGVHMSVSFYTTSFPNQFKIQRKFMRYANTGSSWGPWKEEVFVVDHSENSSGGYTRYSNGTQVCWGTPFSLNANNTEGSLFRSSVNNFWTFPSSFLSDEDVKTVSGYCEGTTNKWINSTIQGGTGTSARVAAYSAVNQATNHLVHMYATGKWR
ncbi:YomR-like protein [Bacillus phage Shbh1]|uniref:YomR-like protein n=1 Tax=Bacillus phage Shbh1 TaxID=1796992 RepID=A0A142F1F9_9CAUD|nr:YomR-like protein [Bacillus phage Shbh1]AMQ66616.1 YomR-like protein [Bacillus phage Shbh1]